MMSKLKAPGHIRNLRCVISVASLRKVFVLKTDGQMDSNACMPKIFYSPMLVTISMVDAFFGVCLETGIPQCLKSLLSQTQNELHIFGKFGDKGDNYTIF